MAYKIRVANFRHTWLQNVRGCDCPEYACQSRGYVSVTNFNHCSRKIIMCFPYWWYEQGMFDVGFKVVLGTCIGVQLPMFHL